MGAIFISYTGRDPEGDAWADRLVGWFQEWNYGYFRDKDHSHGIKAGEEWRPALYRSLGLAQAMVCLCSQQYEGSPWCVGEVAIAVKDGKIMIPLHLLRPQDAPEGERKSHPLPSMLQTRQAIQVADALNPSAEQLAEAKQRLQVVLNESLNWRELQEWDPNQSPYPGLPAFEAHQAPVFFGRDVAIKTVVQRLTSLALSAPGFLLLLGASGYGKSSLVRAGVVPWLRAERQRRWLVLEPLKPGLDPFGALRGVLREHLAAELLAREPQDVDGEAAGLSRQLHSLSSSARAPVVLVIDQFEELLADGNQDGERFLGFLEGLLSTELAEVVVLATMRTDFLAPLQNRWPQLLGLASTMPLEPIRLEDFGELISGPAKRSNLELQPGLRERLVAESGGGDALPLLAFTLEKLWQKWKERGGPMLSPRGERWDLTVADYETLGGVAGAVSSQAKLCWNPQTSSEADTAALREAFLDHLVTLNEEGQAAKRAAELQELPERSRPIVQRMVNRRLLVSDAGRVEIAHEALLRTWVPLVDWIEEGKVELLQCLRVRRLGDDLKAEVPQQRRQAVEQLAALAAADGSEGRAVQKEATEPLKALLAAAGRPLTEREDAALVLALIAEVEPLQKCLADITAPVALRRRAAESLGLLAKRSGDPNQRQQIADELEKWLRSEALDVLIEVEFDPAVVAEVTNAVDGYVQQLATAGRLEGMSEELIARSRQDLVERELSRRPCDSGSAPGWADHDALLPLLQGASRGLQLALSADLPPLGSVPGLEVPMLTLTALEEGSGLRICTEVVEVPVWQLPLPAGEQLELVVVEGKNYAIGSPDAEVGRTDYRQFRSKCDPDEVEVEARRTVRLRAFALVRHPISQAQWRAVVESMAEDKRGSLKPGPGTFRAEDLWQRHGQPGCMPVDSVSWNASQEWLRALNGWLADQWPSWAEDNPAMAAVPPMLDLPSESQWEAACRADTDTDTHNRTPFHFGVTLDASWARYDASYTYGKGRRGEYGQRPVPIGFFGVVNRLGLAELHGQLSEWCGDQWHRDPVAAAPADGAAMEGLDPGLAGDKEQRYRLLRGGSWFNIPRLARAAFRNGNNPDDGSSDIGLRPCGPSPPGSLLGS
jgi:formylglycine-generating enzyme required for sulfatase activity